MAFVTPGTRNSSVGPPWRIGREPVLSIWYGYRPATGIDLMTHRTRSEQSTINITKPQKTQAQQHKPSAKHYNPVGDWYQTKLSISWALTPLSYTAPKYKLLLIIYLTFLLLYLCWNEWMFNDTPAWKHWCWLDRYNKMKQWGADMNQSQTDHTSAGHKHHWIQYKQRHSTDRNWGSKM